MAGPLMEKDWEQLNLTLLSSDADRSLVLFASNDDMHDFRARLDAYRRGGARQDKRARPTMRS